MASGSETVEFNIGSNQSKLAQNKGRMPSGGLCKNCGAELLPEVYGGLCSACLLESCLDSTQESAGGAVSQTKPDAESADREQRPGSRLPCFGDYELLSEIARGGQGVVYRARQKSLNRMVALKMIMLGSWASESHLKRFQTEAEAAANLDHPQIVPIYEVGRSGGQHYFTMKLIDGVSLKQVATDGPLQPRRAALIVAAVARAIHYAHQRGILHRDIKPANILVDAQDQPHVTDFGLAKLVEGESTVTNTMDVLGTPSYMAPEQAAGRAKEVTRAVDTYGLGTVLYELLTGNPPFAGGTTLETIRLVLEREPRRPKLWNPKVDRDLETICLKCLEKHPLKRYESAEALAEDLERWLRHEPIRARPIGFVEQSVKWARRHPATVASMATSAVLATAVGVIVWQSLTAHQARNGRSRSFAVVLRAADTNSPVLSRTCSRELIDLCARLSGLRTLPRSKVLKWESSNQSIEQIGQALGTTAVLLGEVRYADDSLRLRLDLMAFAGGSRTHLWTQELTNSMANWDAMRTQIAREVVGRLEVSLDGSDQALLQRPPSSSPEARRAYFGGCRHLDVLSEVEINRAIKDFESAIQQDPNFAQAHAMLGCAYINLGYYFLDPAIVLAKARPCIQAALAIDPQLPEAKIADGLLKYFYEWDWAGASQALDEAVRLDLSAVESNACFLHMMDVYGQGEEALRKVQRAVSLHPSSRAIQTELSCAAYYAGLFDLAIAYAHESIKVEPDNSVNYLNLGRALAQKGEYEEAVSNLRIAKSKPSDWIGNDAELAYIHAKLGRTNEAYQILATLHVREATEFIDPYVFAVIYAGLGESDRVFEFLNAAADRKSSWIPSFPVEPKFTLLRQDSRYQKLLARLKVPRPPSPGNRQ